MRQGALPRSARQPPWLGEQYDRERPPPAKHGGRAENEGNDVASRNVLNGRLEEFRLVELLQMMGLGSNTGALHIHHDSGQSGIVYFDNGGLVSCVELDTEALTLGHVLQQLNLAGPEHLDHAYHLQTQDPLGPRIGERLVDLGIISPEHLVHALKTQTLWTVRELALWREGSYEFHADERVPAHSTGIHIETTPAMMEVLRYEHEWETLQPFLPDGMRTHLAMAREPMPGHPLRFSAADWRLIARVNEHHTVRRVATSLRHPEVEIARQIGPFVQQGLLIAIGAAGRPGLPPEAVRLSMRHFDLFSLLISMEQDWLKRKSPLEQLSALASFINQTMKALEDACREGGLSLAPDTLNTLLAQRGLFGVDSYRFRIANNQIDVDDFTSYCRDALNNATRGSLGNTKLIYDRCSTVLQSALVAAFESINARVALPLERQQNREAWEALLMTIRGENDMGE